MTTPTTTPPDVYKRQVVHHAHVDELPAPYLRMDGSAEHQRPCECRSGRLRPRTLQPVSYTHLSGKVRLKGEDITGVPPYKRPVNTVFQKYEMCIRDRYLETHTGLSYF